jgi:septal ring factor EnvC (AmiA/AmiB activator)
MNRLVTLHEMRLTTDETINRIHEMRGVEASANRARDESLALHATVKADQARLNIEKAAHESAKRDYEDRFAAIERREAAVAAAESSLSARLATVILRETSVESAEKYLAVRIDRLKRARPLS